MGCKPENDMRREMRVRPRVRQLYTFRVVLPSRDASDVAYPGVRLVLRDVHGIPSNEHRTDYMDR